MPPALPRTKGPLFWILIVIGVLVLLGVSVLGIGGYMVYRVASNAGVDTELFKSNPALATAKLAVSINPDLELISMDAASGEISVRSKREGKIVKMRLDPETRSLTTISDDGTEVRLGDLGDATASLPAWLPPYPGTTPQSNISAKTEEGTSLTFHFKTGDSPKQVLDFYSEQATKAGLEVTSNSVIPGGGMLLAEDLAKDRVSKRQLVVTMAATGDVGISVSEGK